MQFMGQTAAQAVQPLHFVVGSKPDASFRFCQ
jgi:hypothetical protein